MRLYEGIRRLHDALVCSERKDCRSALENYERAVEGFMRAFEGSRRILEGS